MRWFKTKENYPDRDGRSELHYAATAKDEKKVRQLISAGADVNAQDKQGWTPLHAAAQENAFEIAKLLIEAGAKVDVQDAHGNTQLFRAVFSYKDDGRTIELLRQVGSNPLVMNHHGQNPVGLARLIANYDVAKFFSDLPNEKQ
jgi:uncharacterized protein